MAPVVAELQAVGFPINNIIYLAFIKDRTRAFPILLRWLPKTDNRDVKQAIVHMLTHKANRPIAAPALIEEFRMAPSKMSASQEMRFGYTGGRWTEVLTLKAKQVEEERQDITEERSSWYYRAVFPSGPSRHVVAWTTDGEKYFWALVGDVFRGPVRAGPVSSLEDARDAAVRYAEESQENMLGLRS